MRASAIRWWLVGVFCAAGAMGTAAADEQKEIVVGGEHLLFGSLTQGGAVSFFTRGGEYDFEVDGDNAVLDRVDGRNRDVSGVLVGSGDRPGIATDVSSSDVTVSETTVVGSVSIQGLVASFDASDHVDFLRARADLTFTSHTEYNGGAIGGPSDYKIVVVEDKQLFLDGDFRGYGVLLLYDTDPGTGEAMLRMKNRAKWYGVILCYSGDTPGDSDRVRVVFGGQDESGVAAGEGVRVFGMVVCIGEEVEIGFPHDGVGDILYSSAAVANVDAMLQTKPYRWERWRETE